MRDISNYKLDINSAIFIIGVLIILYFLKLIMNHLVRIRADQARILEKLSYNSFNEVNTVNPQGDGINIQRAGAIIQRGNSKGDLVISGVEDEEIIAVILAAVSHASNIPLDSLRVKSIKKVS